MAHRLDVQSLLGLYVGGVEGGAVHTGNKEGGWCTHTGCLRGWLVPFTGVRLCPFAAHAVARGG